MKLLQYLKALADLSFLYAMVGTFLVLAAGANASLAPVFLLALVLPLAHTMRGKAYRFVALAPALLLLPLVIQGVADAVMPLAGVCYLFCAIRAEAYQYTHYHEVDRFHHQLIALPILIGFCALFGFSATMASFTLPLALLYLLSTNLFLRLMRADATTLAQPSFLVAHLGSLVALLVGAAVLSSNGLRSAVLGVLHFLYASVLVPVLVGIAMAVFYALSFIIQIIMWLFGDVELEEVAAAQADYSIAQELTESSGFVDYNAPTWLEWCITIGFVVLVAVVIWRLVRYMLSGMRQKKGDGFVTITQQRIDSQVAAQQPLLALTPRQRVRRTYAAFMRYAKKKGVRITRATDTTQLVRQFGETQEATALTAAYRHARYDETREVSPQEVAAAKAALRAIKNKQK